MNRSTLTCLVAGSIAAVAIGCTPAPAPTSPEQTASAASGAADLPVATAESVAAPAAQFDPAIPAELQSPPAESGGECGIEATETVPQGAMLQLAKSRVEHIEGWALVRDAAAPAEAVYLKLASSGEASYFVPVQMVDRAGLGVRLGEPALDRAGFVVDAGLQHVPAGEYSVQLAQRIDGRVLLCATGRNATVLE